MAKQIKKIGRPSVYKMLNGGQGLMVKGKRIGMKEIQTHSVSYLSKKTGVLYGTLDAILRLNGLSAKKEARGRKLGWRKSVGVTVEASTI